jgi:hypothetical protein
MYATADNIRGLRKFEMIVLPGADSHEEHAEIMRRAAEQEFEVNKSAS